ncbi:MAG: hypothetical protein Q9220_004377 [cf. Caloplaca sp. 1 TL-2023]
MMDDENTLLDFRKRFDELKVSETQRQKLIEDVIGQYDKLLQVSRQTALDLESEKSARRQLQGRIRDELDPMNNQRSFVLVLIDADGDGYVFREEFLNRNEEGGRLAADKLLEAVKHHLKDLGLDVDTTNILVRAYANVKGLGKACVKNKWMSPSAELTSFASGFTGRHPLFDFVNVGAGKERADHKIRSCFEFYVTNMQCKHVVLGVSHDSGYVPFLESFVGDGSLQDRVSLLHGHQVNSGIRNLGFKRQIQFDSVFASGLVLQGQSDSQWKSNGVGGSQSRASKGPFVAPSVDSSKLGPIFKDGEGRRMDRPLDVDQAVVRRLLKSNLCVWLFLKGICKGCERNHAHAALSAQEYDALWSIARQGQCFAYKKGGGCSDATCVYGHRS